MRAVKSVSIDSERRVIITFLDGSTETLYPNLIWCDAEALKEIIKELLEEKADAIVQTINNIAIATFVDGADEALIRKLLVSIDPIQEGTGNPSPENIRPISGRTGLTVYKRGANLIDDSIKNLNSATTSLYIGGPTNAYAYFLKAGTYTLSCDFAASVHYGAYIKETNSNQITVWTTSSANNQATFTLPIDGFYMLWFYQRPEDGGVSVDGVSNIMLNVGDTALPYEPYKQTENVSVNWETEAGTVYGGSLDVVSGRLTVDRVSYVLDGVTNKASDLVQYPQDSDYVNLRGMYRVIVIDLPSGAPYNTQNISSHFIWYKYTGRKNALPDSLITSSAAGVITWASSIYTTLEEFNGYLADQYNAGTPVTLVYELGTPIIYDVTPQEIRTLLGANNIWADSGNILELEYVADTKLYIGESQSATLGSGRQTISNPDLQPVTEKTREELSEAYKTETEVERGE